MHYRMGVSNIIALSEVLMGLIPAISCYLGSLKEPILSIADKERESMMPRNFGC